MKPSNNQLDNIFLIQKAGIVRLEHVLCEPNDIGERYPKETSMTFDIVLNFLGLC
jgi:hypothetical protein